MPKDLGNYDLDMVNLMKNCTLKVTIHREREMKIRVWIAMQLIKLATLITGMGIEFDD